MSLIITLDDVAVNAFRPSMTAGHQKVEQGSDYLPCLVDLSAQITLGLAILTAIAADDLLWAEFGEKSDKDILASITSIAFVNPAEVIELRAYENDATHGRSVPVGVVTYLPFVRLYRNYVLGGATAVLLDLGVAV